jgi:hypothetical protein
MLSGNWLSIRIPILLKLFLQRLVLHGNMDLWVWNKTKLNWNASGQPTYSRFPNNQASFLTFTVHHRNTTSYSMFKKSVAVTNLRVLKKADNLFCRWFTISSQRYIWKQRGLTVFYFSCIKLIGGLCATRRQLLWVRVWLVSIDVCLSTASSAGTLSHLQQQNTLGISTVRPLCYLIQYELSQSFLNSKSIHTQGELLLCIVQPIQFVLWQCYSPCIYLFIYG